MEQVTVTIPRGFQDNGSWLRHPMLRQLTGHDEEYLISIGNRLPSVLRTTALLKRVITFDKAALTESDTEEILRRLAIGDRSALMLHLRRLTFGDLLKCVINCPACKETMSLDLSIDKLLQIEAPPPQTEYIIHTEGFVFKLRPITGADQEALLLKNDRTQYTNQAEQLVRSCIVSSDPTLPHTSLTDDFLAIISSKLEEIDPMADLILDLTCLACQHVFQTPFIVEDFIFHEISARQQQFEQEVHWMAFNYHWSEDAILSLPIKKRKRYVELINRTLSGGGGEEGV
jgi:hypothetical protein